MLLPFPIDVVLVSVEREHPRSEEHTSELQSRSDLVCRLLLEKKKKKVRDPLDVHKRAPSVCWRFPYRRKRANDAASGDTPAAPLPEPWAFHTPRGDSPAPSVH